MYSLNSKTFPVINISHLSQYLNCNISMEMFYDDEKIKNVATELIAAFREWGFVYLIDHHIPQDVIDNAYKTSKDFFMLEHSIKKNYIRTNNGENWGWVPFNVETFEKTRPFDLKECFNFLPTTTRAQGLGDHVAEFMSSQTALFDACKDLSLIMLRILNFILPTEDKNFLNSKHQSIGSLDKNASISRFLYYPPITSDKDIAENQLRCGEHSDYGTFTFLFQDETGGLQVVNPEGDYIDATPIPGSIIMNIGDMLEIWSAGKLKSNRHRVLAPNETPSKPRQSLTLFVHPDNDTMVSCVDGSTKYSPVNSFDYLMNKFKLTY